MLTPGPIARIIAGGVLLGIVVLIVGSSLVIARVLEANRPRIRATLESLMTNVRAKFKVVNIGSSMTMKAVKQEDGSTVHERVEVRTIELNPVYSQDPESENGKFWAASPSGKIQLGTINKAAWENFELDGEYYIDFTKAD